MCDIVLALDGRVLDSPALVGLGVPQRLPGACPRTKSRAGKRRVGWAAEWAGIERPTSGRVGGRGVVCAEGELVADDVEDVLHVPGVVVV